MLDIAKSCEKRSMKIRGYVQREKKMQKGKKKQWKKKKKEKKGNKRKQKRKQKLKNQQKYGKKENKSDCIYNLFGALLMHMSWTLIDHRFYCTFLCLYTLCNLNPKDLIGVIS